MYCLILVIPGRESLCVWLEKDSDCLIDRTDDDQGVKFLPTFLVRRLVSQCGTPFGIWQQANRTTSEEIYRNGLLCVYSRTLIQLDTLRAAGNKSLRMYDPDNIVDSIECNGMFS